MPETIMDFEEIRRLLPQSHPFLMIDRVTEFEADKRLAGHKCVTGNESFFQGHFREVAVMPAALVLEALAQATILLLKKSAGDAGGNWIYLFGSVHAKMHRPILPGDVLRLESTLGRQFGNGGSANGVASVDGKPAVECEMFFSRVRPEDLRKAR
jgi:3-hydroxyacyl-[acyl-carrier-protein] dehydratase